MNRELQDKLMSYLTPKIIIVTAVMVFVVTVAILGVAFVFDTNRVADGQRLIVLVGAGFPAFLIASANMMQNWNARQDIQVNHAETTQALAEVRSQVNGRMSEVLAKIPDVPARE